jgi:peptide/nickel transport system substrate-binding protein
MSTVCSATTVAFVLRSFGMDPTRSSRINRRSLTAAGTTTLVAPWLLGSSVFAQDATPAGEPVAGGTLRVGVQGDPTNLDPHLTVLAAAGIVIELVYDGLVQVDADLIPQPSLAASWTVADDGLTYTFVLRDNAMFHNRATACGG